MRQLQASINELWEVMEGLASKASVPVIDHDANNAADTAEVAAELHPDPFQVAHLGRGWYQVVDHEGKPIHEGKLRKGPAQETWQAAMAGV
jgi:hypothetical protein